MGLFGNKFKKIKRDDVVNSIISLEKQQEEILSTIEDHKKEIEKLFKAGRVEKDRNMQVYYANRINILNKDIAVCAKRLQFITSNVSALNRLKITLDERDFVTTNSKVPINALLNKPAELNKFLSSVLGSKMVAEEKLADSLEMFENHDTEYVENEKLYGVTEPVNSILAMFENEKCEIDNNVFNNINVEEEEINVKEKGIKE